MKEQLFTEKELDDIAERAAQKVVLRIDAAAASKDVQQLINELNNLIN